MSSGQKPTSRLWLFCGGLALFVVGVVVGLFSARWIPGPGSGVPSGDEGLLVQTGEINPHNKPDDFEVFYLRPYATPPELKIIDAGPMIIYQITEQRPHGFRLKISGRRLDETLGKYQARGVAAK